MPDDRPVRLPADDAESVRTGHTSSEVAPAADGTPTRDWGGSHQPPTEPPRADLGGRYRDLRFHRAGGLGRVWLVRDAVIGRDVALKELHPERAGDPQLCARFLEEARVTGQLEHPGIVPLYDLV